jgi:cysteine synthase A
MAQMLASKLGLAVGISSGANFLGAVQIQNELGGHKNVVTTFADSNKKYLSTDLFRHEMILDGFQSYRIELIDYRIISRVCNPCQQNISVENAVI